MSFGKMNTPISIFLPTTKTDEEGFVRQTTVLQTHTRAYREGRHGSQTWANRAAFTKATDLFRFRAIPGLVITTDMVVVCGSEKFEISSVENVKGRNMYIEILATKIEPTGAV